MKNANIKTHKRGAFANAVMALTTIAALTMALPSQAGPVDGHGWNANYSTAQQKASDQASASCRRSGNNKVARNPKVTWHRWEVKQWHVVVQVQCVVDNPNSDSSRKR